jgi:ethanolamine ammonia-lyase large subunit
MLNYQTTSFHDALYVRKTQGLKPSPEFERWLEKSGIWTQDVEGFSLHASSKIPSLFQSAFLQLG